MQMSLFYTGSETSSAVIDRPVSRVRKTIGTQTLSHAMMIDRPAPITPVMPRTPERLPDPSREEEDPERWDGLY